MKIKKQNVFLILSDCISGYGGIAEYNRNILKSLNESNLFNVYAFVRKGKKNIYKHQNYIQFWPIYNKYLFSLFVFIISIFISPRIIFNGHLFTINLAYILSKFHKSKLSTQFHGTEVWDKKLSKNILKKLKSSFSVLSVSNYTSQNLFKFNKINSSVIPNTFNTKFKIIETDTIRKKLNLKKNDIILLTVARLDSRRGGYKGHDRIIDFIYEKRNDYAKNIKYLIIGKGENKLYLQKKIDKLGISDKVFLLGYVKEKELVKYYNESDIFILLSDGEGFGIVYLEAMACGLTSIGLDIGGVSDVLKFDFTKKIKNEKDLEKNIKFLLSRYKSNNARKNISEIIYKEFGYTNFKKKVIKYFTKLS